MEFRADRAVYSWKLVSFPDTRDKWRLRKQGFRSVKLAKCLLQGFNQDQLGEDIIKYEEPNLCCTKKCVIHIYSFTT